MWHFSIKAKNKPIKKTVSDYRQHVIIKQGTEQFKELAKKGLEIKVALL